MHLDQNWPRSCIETFLAPLTQPPWPRCSPLRCEPKDAWHSHILSNLSIWATQTLDTVTSYFKLPKFSKGQRYATFLPRILEVVGAMSSKSSQITTLQVSSCPSRKCPQSETLQDGEFNQVDAWSGHFMKSSFSEEYSRFPPICSAEISEKLTSSYIQMDPALLFCHIPLLFNDTTNMATNAAKDMENCFYRGTLSKGEGSRPLHSVWGVFLGNQTCSCIHTNGVTLSFLPHCCFSRNSELWQVNQFTQSIECI